MTAAKVGKLMEAFGELGWSAAVGVGDGWESSYLDIPIKAHLSCSWVSLEAPLSNLHDLQVAELLNSRFHLARVCRNGAGKLLLRADWPAEELDRGAVHLLVEAFSRAIETLRGWAPPGRSKFRSGSSAPAGTTGGDTSSSANLGPRREPVGHKLPKDQILRYFRQIDHGGWFHGDEEDDNWPFVYYGIIAKQWMRMTFTEHWTHFHARLITGQEQKTDDDRLTICAHLLDLNGELRMARLRCNFVYGEVILCLQCPTERLNFNMYSAMMDGMGTYIDRVGTELQILMCSERLRKFVSTGVLPPTEFDAMEITD